MTAVSTGAGSSGLDYELSGLLGGRPSIEVKAVATIAKGAGKDVVARDPNASGASVKIDLDHSDFATTEASPSGGGVTITAPDQNSNVVAAPLLATDGYHELSNSPTIDSGATDPLSGAVDVDGQLRSIGQPDIGADEAGNSTATRVSCLPGTLGVAPGNSAACTATVTDTSASPTAPVGKVVFASTGAGAFSDGATCTVAPAGQTEASCQLAYTPSARGIHRITASFIGSTHDASGGTATVNVGAVRYAAPGGTGQDPCSDPAHRCSLFAAASNAAPGTTVAAGDEVVLAPGEYTNAAGDLGPQGSIALPSNVSLHGEAGRPRPLIVSKGATSEAMSVQPGDLVSHVEIDTANAINVIALRGGTVEDLIARSSRPGVAACELSNGVIRNSVCVSSGAQGIAIGFGTQGGNRIAILRGVTAVSTGAESLGLRFIGNGGAATPTSIKLEGSGVIAKGTATDVVAEALSLDPHTPGTGATVEIDLDHSDYATTSTVTDAGGGTATISPTGAGTTNVDAAPLLAADDYHQLPGSPTVDAGPADDLGGVFDVDGQLRRSGSATDIGADEVESASATSVDCAPARVPFGSPTTCTATVPIRPTRVRRSARSRSKATAKAASQPPPATSPPPAPPPPATSPTPPPGSAVTKSPPPTAATAATSPAVGRPR